MAFLMSSARIKSKASSIAIAFACRGKLQGKHLDDPGTWTKSTLENVERQDYDVFLLPGDLSYANCDQPLWDSFGRLVEPSASRRPWMVTQGNHDVESFRKIFPKAFKAYNARWPMAFEESNSTSNLYYSFDVAATHVLMLGQGTRIYDNQTDPCGPMYVTIGDGGNREGLAFKFINPEDPLSVYREASFGHGRLRIVNETHAEWSWHRNNDTEAVVADHC